MPIFNIIESSSEWNNLISDFREIDFYYTFEYGTLFAEIENGRLYAAYYKDDHSHIFYPFVKREISFEEGLYDIVTPYGYGGPLIQGENESLVSFYKYFAEYCKRKNIITETIRFHPLNKNYKNCKKIMDVDYIRKTTAVNLTVPLEEIRNNYSSMNKRNIKKAINNGLSFFLAENIAENIQIFIDLYNETMKRNNANSYYYFDEKYFLEQVKDTCKSKTYILFAKFNEEIIAGVMVIVGEKYSHYHLGASRTKYLNLRPNNALFDFMIEFCKSKGSVLLHLGGGYAEGDGLFQFKTSFTNNNNFEYYIGKKVYNKDKYKCIVDKIKENYIVNDSYFPIYRGNLQKRSDIKIS